MPPAPPSAWSPPGSRRRLAPAALVAAVVAGALATPGAAGAERSAGDARARGDEVVVSAAAAGDDRSAGDARARGELVLRAAALTDRLEEAEASVVAARLRSDRAAATLAAARRRARARAVTAYMRGAGAGVDALMAWRPYLEVVASQEREVVAGYRAAVRAADAQRRRADDARAGLRAAAAELAAVRAALDVRIATDDARRAEERRRADAARAEALRRAAAARADAVARRAGAQGDPRRRALAAAGASPGAVAPSPLDPSALLPRHRAATERQQGVMRRFPFGPLAHGTPPPGLVPTGRRVEGQASWYGPGFNGRPTASGAIYDQEGWTAASPDLPLGTLLVVTRGDRRALVLVNDRGPYVDGRVLDLSAATARALGIGGVAPVVAEVVGLPAD